MNTKKPYSRPQLSVIDPADPHWRNHLPRVRELTKEALHEVVNAEAPEIAAELEALLELINREIAVTNNDELE